MTKAKEDKPAAKDQPTAEPHLDALIAERDALKEQLAAVVAERDALVAARDEVATAHAQAIEQAVRDAIKATSDAMAQSPAAPPPEAGVRSVGYIDSSTTPIRYIGRRESHVDGAYGTRMQWTQGQTRMVPRAIAALMLKHTDVYEMGEPVVESGPFPTGRLEPIDKDQEDVQQALDQIANMDKVALKTFAKTMYNMDVPANGSLGDMRTAVTGLVHQFGLG